ncbi:putative salt-induced outer membrane protein [Pseudarcicella hirudinis]|uniref:Putative salt-induced outer membrane protein n=1 Tax=Pseudarcicella hirudinis TaxID=1079859 RepID=A0A1I5Z2W8_9BACT|nr:hypothetical protein [Pseudarcicella hirudinis]SFQ50813.1 putative salt-induced outer membrane protein [Pseudarcicella hirudinis]
MKKKTLFLAFLMAFTVQVFAQTPDEIFNKYFESTGGKALWNDVKTYSLKQSFYANAPTDYEMDIKASLLDNSVIKTKTILKRDFIYGISSSDAWLKIPMGSRDKNPTYDVKDLSDKEHNNMKRELQDFLSPMLNYQAKNYIASFVGLENDGAKKVNHVQLSGKDVIYDLYFDPATNLLTKEKIKLAATGEEIVKTYSAYATSDYGIKYPSEGTYTSSLDKKTVKLTTKMVYNDQLTGVLFKR